MTAAPNTTGIAPAADRWFTATSSRHNWTPAVHAGIAITARSIARERGHKNARAADVSAAMRKHYLGFNLWLDHPASEEEQRRIARAKHEIDIEVGIRYVAGNGRTSITTVDEQISERFYALAPTP